ncbi:MAG: hypothetical protein QF787_08705 [Nitrospinota bacterium]|nr:hypothetical protein [Nitrospinota bacterium]
MNRFQELNRQLIIVSSINSVLGKLLFNRLKNIVAIAGRVPGDMLRP